MGLLTSVNNLNYTLQAKEEEKKAKEAERKAKEKARQKAKEEKEAKERLKNEIDTFLYNYFKEFLIKNGSNNIYYFYNSNLKNSILQQILDNYTIIKTFKTKNGSIYNNNYVQYKDFIIQFYNNNYFKILKKAEEEQKKNEQYIYYNAILTQNTEKEEQQQQQEQVQYTQAKKQYNYNTIYTILKIIFYIICAPIAFLILILISACKNQK